MEGYEKGYEGYFSKEPFDPDEKDNPYA